MFLQAAILLHVGMAKHSPVWQLCAVFVVKGVHGKVMCVSVQAFARCFLCVSSLAFCFHYTLISQGYCFFILLFVTASYSQESSVSDAY